MRRSGREEEILEAVLGLPRTVRGLSILIYGDGERHNNIMTYVTALESRGWVTTKKDRTVGGPGAKPTVVGIDSSLPTLEEIWYKYPQLRGCCLKNRGLKKYYPDLVVNEIESMLKRTPGAGGILTKSEKNCVRECAASMPANPDLEQLARDMGHVHSRAINGASEEKLGVPVEFAKGLPEDLLLLHGPNKQHVQAMQHGCVNRHETGPLIG